MDRKEHVHVDVELNYKQMATLYWCADRWYVDFHNVFKTLIERFVSYGKVELPKYE